ALVGAGGVKVDVFACDRLHPDCRTAPGNPIGSTFTDANGACSVSLLFDLEFGKLLLMRADVDAVNIDAFVTPHRRGEDGARQLSQGGGTAADILIDPISEAAARLLDERGVENYSDQGIDTVIDAVTTAVGSPPFGGLGVGQAADLAETTAASDAAVQNALVENATPTPSATPCVGDCDSSGTVTVDEIITGVNIALGTAL